MDPSHAAKDKAMSPFMLDMYQDLTQWRNESKGCVEKAWKIPVAELGYVGILLGSIVEAVVKVVIGIFFLVMGQCNCENEKCFGAGLLLCSALMCLSPLVASLIAIVMNPCCCIELSTCESQEPSKTE